MDIETWVGRTAGLARERGEVEQRIKDNQLRDARIACIERALREAIASAPDLFGKVDTQGLAAHIVDGLLS